jgi:serine/threonine-protein kinase
VEESVDIAIQILDGLGYAHDEGIVHQDIKPANILIEERTQRPLIADFGIAKAVQVECSSQIDVIIGSPVYISPEQASAANTDGRTDIYSAGVTLFAMLAGQLPRRNENVAQILMRKINEPATFFTLRPSEAAPRIDAALEQIILRAIEPDLTARYQDCRTFKEELQAYRTNHISR